MMGCETRNGALQWYRGGPNECRRRHVVGASPQTNLQRYRSHLQGCGPALQAKYVMNCGHEIVCMLESCLAAEFDCCHALHTLLEATKNSGQ